MQALLAQDLEGGTMGLPLQISHIKLAAVNIWG